MAHDEEVEACERTPLLDSRIGQSGAHGDEANSILSSAISKEEQALGGTAIGERLPYNDYTTIDWLHDLVDARSCHGQVSRLTVHI
jgi:chloride channel 3/4/5